MGCGALAAGNWVVTAGQTLGLPSYYDVMGFVPCLLFFTLTSNLQTKPSPTSSGQAHGQWETLHVPDIPPQQTASGHIRAFFHLLIPRRS